MALYQSVYLGNLLLFIFISARASVENGPLVEYPIESFSNLDTSSAESTLNASEILQHLIDKRLKLNCANLSTYYDPENPTDLEKLLNISVQPSEVNQNREEYHHRMKRCSELERQNRILQEFATRQQSPSGARKADKTHPVKKLVKNQDHLVLEKHLDVDQDEIHGDMVHSVHHLPSTSIFTTAVTESLPRESAEMDVEDGKMLAEAVLQRFNVNRDQPAFESDHGTNDVPNHVKDAHPLMRTDRSSPKPPSLLQKIRDIMKGGSLKDAENADSARTPSTEHSSTYKMTRLEYENVASSIPRTSHDSNDPSIPPKNIFQYVTDAVNRGYHLKNDSGSNLSKVKSRANSLSTGTLNQRNSKDDSLPLKIEELTNLHKLLSELLRSHNSQKNQANGNSMEHVRSTHHQPDPKMKKFAPEKKQMTSPILSDHKIANKPEALAPKSHEKVTERVIHSNELLRQQNRNVPSLGSTTPIPNSKISQISTNEAPEHSTKQQITITSSTPNSSQKTKPRINSVKASIHQKIDHTIKQSYPSTPSFSTIDENFEKMVDPNGDGKMSSSAGQTSPKNGLIRKQTSTSTQAAKSTSPLPKHLPPYDTMESKVPAQQFSTIDQHFTDSFTKHHTPKPDLSSNQSSHLEPHSISKGQKSVVQDEPQSRSFHLPKPPLLRTEIQKATFTPKTVLTNDNEQTTEDLRSIRSTLIPLHYPTLTTIARNHSEGILRQSSVSSSTIQKIQLNEGKHHFTDTTPLLPLLTTASLKNKISIPETTHKGDATAIFSSQPRSESSGDILMTEHRGVSAIEPHLESLHRKVSSLQSSVTPQKPHITHLHHQEIPVHSTTPAQAPLNQATHPSPSNLLVPSTYTTSPHDEDIKTILEDIMRLEKEKREELINMHKIHLKRLQKDKEHATPTQVPFLDQKITHTNPSNLPIPTTQVITSQNEDIASIIKEIMELEKEKRNEVMNLHKNHLKILLRDKEGIHVTQAPLVHEKVTHSSSHSDLHIPITQTMTPQNEDITSIIKEITELEKEKREELMHLHRNHLKTLLRDTENIPVTQEPFLEPKIAHHASSNSYPSSTHATTSQNDDIKTIIEDITRLEKEKREELINLHKSYLKRLQKDKENTSFLDQKMAHTTSLNSQTPTIYATTPHDNDIKTTLADITRSENDRKELINSHKNHLKGLQKDKENTTPPQALLSDQKITPTTPLSSHIAPDHVTARQNEDIKTILEDIMKLEKERREELINLHKNHLKGLQSNKDSTAPTQVSILDQKMTHTTPLNPHVSTTHVIPSQNDEITSILEEIMKLEKERREELLNLHKTYLESHLKDKADKPLSKSSSELEHSSKYDIIRGHVFDSSTSPSPKVTPPSHMLDHQRAFFHSRDRSANAQKDEISHVHDTANSHSADSHSTTIRISNGLENDHNPLEGEENVQKPHLPHPPLNPNENWKFAHKLDEFYEKQKSQTTPTPRRTRPTTVIPSSTTRQTTEVPHSSIATSKITPRMRSTTEYTLVPRNSSRSTNRSSTTTQATPTTTAKSKEKGYSVNSTITRNYNITINLAPPEIPKSSDKDDDSSESYDDSAPSPYPPYPAPMDDRAQSFSNPDELTGMSSPTPKNSDAQPSVTPGEYTAMPYTPYPSPMGFGLPLPPLPPMQYSNPPYLPYPPPIQGMIPPPNQFNVPSYPPYPPSIPQLVDTSAPFEGATQFSGPISMSPSQFDTNGDQPNKPFIFENNDAILESPRPHFPILKAPEVVTASPHHERLNNQESKNMKAHAYLHFDMENLATKSPPTDINADKLDTAILAHSSCPDENCTKKECNNVYVIPDRSADVMQILRLLNVVKPQENGTGSAESSMLRSSNSEVSSIANNSEILGSSSSNSMSNIKNMLSSIQGSISTGSDTAQLRQSINELLALLKERRNQEYTNLYATRLNPNNSYGKNNVVTIMQINEYIELLELMLVYLARDPDKLLDEGKDARISNDESPYPRNDPHRRLIEDQFYYVHPKILNEFIDVYKKYSRDDSYFGRPMWRNPQENAPRSTSRGNVIGKSLNQLFHLQGLLPELMYNRAAMYKPGVDYVD